MPLRPADDGPRAVESTKKSWYISDLAAEMRWVELGARSPRLRLKDVGRKSIHPWPARPFYSLRFLCPCSSMHGCLPSALYKIYAIRSISQQFGFVCVAQATGLTGPLLLPKNGVPSSAEAMKLADIFNKTSVGRSLTDFNTSP